MNEIDNTTILHALARTTEKEAHYLLRTASRLQASRDLFGKD